ncbi:hypothetical protein [Staphylococcus pseudoxylosus]|uniref:hypothetical protein n=1 Tax=Staphylococcus pseudoxylosus TaxID=2282419 RepID=UPI000F523D16|nr:hypothetical protein [Staphylococcus pseudoxylosus]MBM2657832.1 hypothetical protein [Staphylococcus pseudoxylosus]MEB6332438.1 hypothetical protein [Staphylococcus pseudoxylosus]RQM85176.1 hypothetical protein CO206_04325 [Staphylococcus xylosus]
MGYAITFIVVAGLIGLYFAKREKQMSPSSWFKGIGVIIVSLVIVDGFYHVDDIQKGAKDGMKEANLEAITSK